MPVLMHEAPPLRRFAGWSVACWIVLLLAAFGAVLYLRHRDYSYLLGALVVVVVCAGGIARQPWARNALRVLALLLAAWALVTGGLMIAHWDQFELARQHALGEPHADLVLLVIEQARRDYLFGLVLKALAIPLLLWLAWRLGTPAVRAQFGAPRKRV